MLLALLIGVVAGLRAMTAPAAVSWAASVGWLDVSGSWLAFLASTWTKWIFTGLAMAELVGDQLPSTPSRTVPMQFGARLVSGALSGGAIAGVAGGMLGVVGAVIGTFGGSAIRARLAAMFRRDPPAALIEDAVAIVGAALIAMALRSA